MNKQLCSDCHGNLSTVGKSHPDRMAGSCRVARCAITDGLRYTTTFDQQWHLAANDRHDLRDEPKCPAVGKEPVPLQRGSRHGVLLGLPRLTARGVPYAAGQRQRVQQVAAGTHRQDRGMFGVSHGRSNHREWRSPQYAQPRPEMGERSPRPGGESRRG